MKKIIFLFLLITLLFFSSCSVDNKVEKKVQSQFENQTIIVAFGDSLTAGLGLNQSDAYPAQLELYLKNKGYSVKVFNSGLSGETSSGALSRVDWVLQLNPKIVILEIGANDAFRGINLNLTKTNIEKIITKLQKNNVIVVLVGLEMVENLGEKYVTEFKNIYPSVVNNNNNNNNITFVPNFLKGVAGVDELNQKDKIHPKKKGYFIVVKNNVGPVIEKLIISRNLK